MVIVGDVGLVRVVVSSCGFVMSYIEVNSGDGSFRPSFVRFEKSSLRMDLLKIIED